MKSIHKDIPLGGETCEGGRDWNYATTNQGIPAATEGRRGKEGSILILDFWPPARCENNISTILRHIVHGTFSQQTLVHQHTYQSQQLPCPNGHLHPAIVTTST